MSAPMVEPVTDDVKVIEELLRTLDKGTRALQMYLPNNPVYQRAVEQLAAAFTPVWGLTGCLVLEIHENDATWEGVSVLPSSSRGDGFVWQLYKDGLRRLTFTPGVESEEIIRFLEVVNRARRLAADASDDLLTLLWEQEFVLISYAFIEALGDGIEFMQESPIREVRPPAGAAKEEVATTRGSADGGLAEIDEEDSTPYFLDEAEIRFIRGELDEEYRRDIRQAAIDALLDILETIADPVVRREVVGLLEQVLPAQLATGGFGSVAHILRELRVINARVPGLDQELHAAILSFEDRLSEPEILEQLFRVLEDSGVRDGDADVSAVIRELKPSALPTVLAHLGRSLDPGVRRLLSTSVDDLVRTSPAGLGAVLDSAPPDALEPALEAVARLKLQAMVPKVLLHLQHGTEPVRVAAVQALAGLGTPTAIAALEEALLDPDRTVRQMAMETILARGGSGRAQGHIEKLLFGDTQIDLERSERRAMFEAYAELAGGEAMPRMQSILEPKGLFRRSAAPELRACAIYALARIRTFEARMLVDRFTGDKEPVVRAAANTVLREWTP